MERDVFISHASEDKAAVARPLAQALASVGLRVWLDEFEIKLGDSLRRKIDEGLACSRFGIVVLSKAFFAKDWPKRELNALLERESENRRVVLPIWHEIDREDVARFSPLLVDKIAISTKEGIEAITNAIIRVAGTVESNSLFRVFSYDERYKNTASEITFRSIQYLDLEASSISSNVSVHLKRTEGFDVKANGTKLIEVVEGLWEPSIRLLSILAGWRLEDVIAGRRQVHESGVVVERNLDGPDLSIKEWRSFSALLHLRGYHSARSVDRDYLDLFFIPSSDPYAQDWAPVEDDKAVIKRLISLKQGIKDSLKQIAAVSIGAAEQDISVRNPVWDKDCTPVWGGDAYWLRAMLQ